MAIHKLGYAAAPQRLEQRVHGHAARGARKFGDEGARSFGCTPKRWTNRFASAASAAPIGAVRRCSLPIQEGANQRNGGLRVLFHDPVP